MKSDKKEIIYFVASTLEKRTCPTIAADRHKKKEIGLTIACALQGMDDNRQ